MLAEQRSVQISLESARAVGVLSLVAHTARTVVAAEMDR